MFYWRFYGRILNQVSDLLCLDPGREQCGENPLLLAVYIRTHLHHSAVRQEGILSRYILLHPTFTPYYSSINAAYYFLVFEKSKARVLFHHCCLQSVYIIIIIYSRWCNECINGTCRMYDILLYNKLIKLRLRPGAVAHWIVHSVCIDFSSWWPLYLAIS